MHLYPLLSLNFPLNFLPINGCVLRRMMLVATALLVLFCFSDTEAFAWPAQIVGVTDAAVGLEEEKEITMNTPKGICSQPATLA